MKYIISSLLVFFSVIGYSQSLQELFENPNITFVIEVVEDYDLRYTIDNRDYDKTELKNKQLTKGYHDPLKYRADIFAPPSKLDYHEFSILDILATHLTNPNFKIYKDDKLSVEIKEEERNALVISIDTFISFDPTTFEEIMYIDTNSRIDNFLYLRLKHYVYYNKEDLMFHSIPLAAAIMIGESDEYYPLAWFPIEKEAKMPDLTPSHITWARRTKGFNTRINGGKIIKQMETHLEAGREMLRAIRKKENIKVHEVMNLELMPKEEVERIGLTTDTIISFHPETFEEIATVETYDINERADQMNAMRFVNAWVWDEKALKLSITPIALAPIIDRCDENWNWVASTPIFFRYYK